MANKEELTTQCTSQKSLVTARHFLTRKIKSFCPMVKTLKAKQTNRQIEFYIYNHADSMRIYRIVLFEVLVSTQKKKKKEK